jgi:hypothetical protein
MGVEDFYSLICNFLIGLTFVTLILAFLYIAYGREERTSTK